MKPISEQIQKLAKQFNLTDHDEPEQYVLTPDEEVLAIENAIISAKKQMAWKMREASANEEQVESRLRHTDWNKAIDKTALLKKANTDKLQDLWHKQNREAEKEKMLQHRRDIAAKCTAGYMFRLMWQNCLKIKGRELIYSENTKPLIVALCYFFSNDKRFETELGYDLSKGLIIRGACGLGKTFLIELLKDNELNPVYIKSMLRIAEDVLDYGEWTPPLGIVLYLDDVGSEEAVVTHYGTKINWFKNFIEQAYNSPLAFNKIIFSTNNSFDQLQEKYGYRVRSRFKEMFNVIDVTGEDLRR